ncbi:MAG TPA: PAS domain S-box protein [Pyrinomonadaceae bacterium]|nr:PAS domain S-box protein [Pyrinomonadaceae bacterium]
MKRISSIAAQSLLAVLLTVISVLALSSFIELSVLKQRETRLLQNRGALMTTRMANSLSYTLWNLNREETQRVVLDEIGSEDVSRIQVFDEKGVLYLGAVKDVDGTIKVIDGGAGSANIAAPPQHTFSENIIHGSKIGSVRLDVTDTHLQAELSKLKWGIAIKLLLLVILLSVVLLVALRVLVISPLSALEKWVERIPTEKAPTRLRFKRSEEIDSLAEAFSKMSQNLKDKNEELFAEQARLQEANRQMQVETEERQRAEAAVMLSEQKFEKSFRSSPVALAVTRFSDGTLLEVNEAMEEFIGYERDELLGRSTIELGLWLEPGGRAEMLAELTSVGSIHNREIQFVNKQEKVAIANYSADLIEIGGEQCVLSVLVDVTARRIAEESLRANEALLRLFIQHTPAAIAMFDTEMRYLQVSDRFLTNYHLDGQNIIGKSHYEVFPNLPERWKQVHRRILAGATERCEEDANPLPDGGTEWLQWESLPWRKANNDIGGLILFTQNITERKQAEAALRTSEERFAKMFNLSPYRMGIIRIRDGVVLEVNDSWVRETGFERDEILNRSILTLADYMAPEMEDQIRKILKENFSPGAPAVFEGHLRTKFGDERVTNTMAVRFDLDGEPCYLWAANDITERKRAENALRESETRYQSLLYSVEGIVWEADAKTFRFSFVSAQAERLLGYPVEQWLNEPTFWKDHIHPEDRAWAINYCVTATRDMRPHEFEYRMIAANGNVLWLRDIVTVVVENNEPKTLRGLMIDVTAQKRADDALRALSARVHSAREEEGTRIAREIHDELGGALTGLKWDLETIDKSLDRSGNDPGLADMRKRIGTMTNLIEATINAVRRISSDLRPGVLDDLGLVAAIEWQVQQFQSRTGLECHWKAEVDEVELSLERATVVFRIFQEVLTNVLRHAAATNLYVTIRQVDERLELEVKDDGRGISDSERSNPRSLGLLGMKERALLVGGEVEIYGSEGKGTTVLVRVPLDSSAV